MGQFVRPMPNARSLSEAGGQTSFRAAAIRGWELPRRLGVVVLAHGELGVGEGVVGKEVTSMSKPVIQQQDHQQAPWNKGRLVGQKRPLKPREVWNIRARLQIDARRHDLAM